MNAAIAPEGRCGSTARVMSSAKVPPKEFTSVDGNFADSSSGKQIHGQFASIRVLGTPTPGSSDRTLNNSAAATAAAAKSSDDVANGDDYTDYMSQRDILAVKGRNHNSAQSASNQHKHTHTHTPTYTHAHPHKHAHTCHNTGARGSRVLQPTHTRTQTQNSHTISAAIANECLPK